MAGQLLLVNPGPKKGRKGAKRRATSAKKRPARRRSTSMARLRRRSRRNPIAGRGMVGAVVGQVTGAGLGAVGGAALDFALRFLPLQAKTGPVGHLARAGIAIGAGLLGKRIPMVAQAAQGALTITLYNVLRQYVTVPMNMGEISDADVREIQSMGGTDIETQPLLGAYEPSGGVGLGLVDDSLGAYSPATVY